MVNLRSQKIQNRHSAIQKFFPWKLYNFKKLKNTIFFGFSVCFSDFNTGILLIIFVLFFASSLMAQPDGFRIIYTLRSGYSAVIKKKESSSNLIIYAGRNALSKIELATVSGKFFSSGFHLITFSHKNPITAEAIVPDTELGQLLRFSLLRPGYKKKILIVQGVSFASIPEMIDSSSINAIIVIRPGDVVIDPNKVEKLMMMNTPMLWISHQGSTEERKADYLFSLLKNKSTIQRTSIQSTFYDATALSPVLFDHDDFLNFILLTKLNPSWIPAQSVFPGGCFFRPDEKYRIQMNSYYASGKADPDFCPLFLKTHTEEIYRAKNAGTLCEYSRNLPRVSIYCKLS